MAYGNFKDFAGRTALDEIFLHNAVNIDKNPKHDKYQRDLPFFKKKHLIKRLQVEQLKNENISIKELKKTIIKKLNKRNVQLHSRENIWSADLADMQLISIFDNGIRFLSCVIDILSKYAWVIPLKNKKGITITNSFQKTLDKSNCKSYEIWVDKGSEF